MRTPRRGPRPTRRRLTASFLRAAAGLMAYMRDETSLNLTKKQIGTGNICAVSSNIIMRAVTGCAAPHARPRTPAHARPGRTAHAAVG